MACSEPVPLALSEVEGSNVEGSEVEGQMPAYPAYRRQAQAGHGARRELPIFKKAHYSFLSFLEILHPEWYGLPVFHREFWGFLSLGKTGFP